MARNRAAHRAVEQCFLGTVMLMSGTPSSRINPYGPQTGIHLAEKRAFRGSGYKPDAATRDSWLALGGLNRKTVRMRSCQY